MLVPVGERSGKRKLAAEAWVGQEPGLNDLRLRDPDLLEMRLQLAIVQKRDLDRALGRERPAEQAFHPLLDLRVFRTPADPMDALARTFLHRGLDPVERAARRRAAAREERRHQGDDRMKLHRFAPSFEADALIKVMPQLGQFPGLLSLISGCIGQVKISEVGAEVVAVGEAAGVPCAILGME